MTFCQAEIIIILQFMNKIFDGYFYNPTCGDISLEATVREIVKYFSEKPEIPYELIVGCDSSSGEHPNFPVAIVVLRKGQGGRFFLKRINYKDRKFYSWKRRILEEVFLSCQLALLLKEKVEKEAEKMSLSQSYEFRYIHADVGENGQTKDMVREVVGLIRGNGFEAKIKPESYAASSVADRFA